MAKYLVKNIDIRIDGKVYKQNTVIEMPKEKLSGLAYFLDELPSVTTEDTLDQDQNNENSNNKRGRK